MLNQCNFIGRIGQEPEIRYSSQGTAVANISIGCSEKWKDKQSGEQKERTEWVRCSAFGKLAEIMGEYLQKGSLIYVSGKMQTRKWQDQSGQDRYSTEVVVSEMKMLGGKSDAQQHSRQKVSASQQPHQTQNQPQYNEPPMDFDDEIPFAPVGLQYNNGLIHVI